MSDGANVSSLYTVYVAVQCSIYVGYLEFFVAFDY